MRQRKNAFYPWGLFGYTLSYQAFSNRVQFYYIDVLGLGAAAISTMWFLFGIWNAVNDPLMGQLSDRTRSRWGRRVPYLRFGAIPLGIAFFLLWTPLQADRTLTVVYFLLAVFVFDTLATIMSMCLNSLFPEITSTIEERASLGAARESMSAASLLLAFILAPILSTRLGYPAMGAIIGLIAAATLFVSVIGIKENPERQDEQPAPFLASIKSTFANRPFRWFLGSALMREFNFITLAATVPFWRKYVLQIQSASDVFGVRLGPDLQEALLLGVPFILAIPCLQIWRRVTARIGARRAWMAACLSWVPGLVVIYLANNFYVALLGTALVAPGLAGYLMMFVVTLSEITDYDSRITGLFREGTFFGIAGLFMRLAFSLQALLFALLLEPSGYVPNQAIQPAGAVGAIRLIMAGAPLVACLISAACLYFLRIPPKTEQPAAGHPAGTAMPRA
jgi:GPH family glycoside/pentoside/hexuronide:cation symporter